MASAEGETGSAPPAVSAFRGDSSGEPVGEILRESLRSLPKLVGQLNLGEDVVKINIDWSKLQHASPFQPTLLFTALQQHISALQPFIEKLQSLIKEESTALVTDSSKTEDRKCETNSNVTDKELQMEEKSMACGSANVKMSHVDFDPEVVQIKAGKAEIERRISAFIERKQAEINENNVREFCNVIDCNQENSCARTDAVFTPYPGFKSHVKGGPVPKDIYQRIKKLEDKILELEGMSPEYFQSVNLSSKRRKAQQTQNYSLAELDEKINALKQTILRKTNEGRPSVVDQLL
ncbi:MAP3K12-binding inhibitory protein 1 isoform X4 [Pogona vitticeps]